MPTVLQAIILVVAGLHAKGLGVLRGNSLLKNRLDNLSHDAIVANEGLGRFRSGSPVLKIK